MDFMHVSNVCRSSAFLPPDFPPPLDFPAVSAIYALLDEKSVAIFAVASGSGDLSTPRREPMHAKLCTFGPQKNASPAHTLEE